MKRAALLLLALAAISCADDGGTPQVVPTVCGLPTPERRADPNLVPDPFLPEGVTLVSTDRHEQGFVATINTPYGVGRALEIYRDAAQEAGFGIITEENEGFEAEVYLKRGKDLGAVQIRQSACPQASVVFINIVRR